MLVVANKAGKRTAAKMLSELFKKNNKEEGYRVCIKRRR